MTNPSGKEKLTVVHSLLRWLPLTQNWLYHQIRRLPFDIESHVAAVRWETENRAQFALPNIHCLADRPIWRYISEIGDKQAKSRIAPIRLSGKVLDGLQRWPYPDFLAQTALENGAQVLHSHFGNRGWLDIKAARQAGLKHVVTFYGADVNRLPVVKPWWRQRYRALFKQVDGILCEGPHMAQCIVNLGCPEHKVHVHHLGIKVDEIAFRPRVWNSDGPLRVLIAAAFREKKGIPYALEALGRLQHQVSLEITIIGDATGTARSQAEKRKILATIEKHQLEPRVRMLGYQPHAVLFEQAYEHHIFLSPSVTASDGDTEGGAPIAIIEMAATGMPIVSTTHCDIPGVVQPDLVSLLAEERDVDGLVRYIKWLIEHREQWPGILEAGRKHVEAEFDVRLQGERLAGIYRKLVNE